ncbi:MAG: hypothetical protein HAW64_01145, partial [Alphaproteobacteria bacterium]|nr:hypothetical protein [Alphaproteobacteria bacterium]
MALYWGMRLILLCLLLWSPPTLAASESSAWQRHEAVSARLITTATTIAVELKLADGWHTYWREPGASGIAPEFTYTTSPNIEIGAVVYPPPIFVDDGSGGYYGYEGGVIFQSPLHRLDAGAGHIGLSLFIGV